MLSLSLTENKMYSFRRIMRLTAFEEDAFISFTQRITRSVTERFARVTPRHTKKFLESGTRQSL